MTDPSGLIPPGELVQGLKREIDRFVAVRSELEALPWFGSLMAANEGIKKWRLHSFLRAVDTAEGQLDPQARERLRDAANKLEGAELLVDYAERVVRTSSRIAITAFGLLYADPDDVVYTRGFRRLACEALEGISDDLVDLFLALLEAADFMISRPRPSTGTSHQVPGGTVDVAGPFVIVLPQEDFLVERIGVEAARLYSGHQQLTGRGLILADPSSGRFGGARSLAFGIGDDTRRFQGLLGQARDVLGRDA